VLSAQRSADAGALLQGLVHSRRGGETHESCLYLTLNNLTFPLQLCIEEAGPVCALRVCNFADAPSIFTNGRAHFTSLPELSGLTFMHRY
jgi:hypothetical protein